MSEHAFSRRGPSNRSVRKDLAQRSPLSHVMMDGATENTNTISHHDDFFGSLAHH